MKHRIVLINYITFFQVRKKLNRLMTANAYPTAHDRYSLIREFEITMGQKFAPPLRQALAAKVLL